MTLQRTDVHEVKCQSGRCCAVNHRREKKKMQRKD